MARAASCPPEAGNLEDARAAAAKGRYAEARKLLVPLDGDFVADRLRPPSTASRPSFPRSPRAYPRRAWSACCWPRRSDDRARGLMLAAFEVLGDDDPATREYRRRLSNALF